MTLFDVLHKGTRIGTDLYYFFRHPRTYVLSRLSGPKALPLKEIIAWTVGVCAIAWGGYSLAVSPPLAKLYHALGLGQQSEVASAHSPPPDLPVQFKGISWRLGVGVGVTFPQAMTKSWSEPQLGIFQMGIVGVILDRVSPAHLSGVSGQLMLSLYALVSVLCMHWPAQLLGAKVHFTQEWRLASIFFFYSVLITVLAVILGCILLLDLARLKGNGLSIGWALLVIMPVFLLALRSFFASFSELYSVTKKRLLLIGAGAILLSSVISPLVFVPGIYLIVRFSAWLKLIF